MRSSTILRGGGVCSGGWSACPYVCSASALSSWSCSSASSCRSVSCQHLFFYASCLYKFSFNETKNLFILHLSLFSFLKLTWWTDIMTHQGTIDNTGYVYNKRNTFSFKTMVQQWTKLLTHPGCFFCCCFFSRRCELKAAFVSLQEFVMGIKEMPRLARFIPKIMLAITVTACDEVYRKIACWLNDMGETQASGLIQYAFTFRASLIKDDPFQCSVLIFCKL